MGLPHFLDGVQFSGQVVFWAVINGQVCQGRVQHSRRTPYLAYFGERGAKNMLWYRWSQFDTPTTFVYLWVEECYTSEQAAEAVQHGLKCRCGKGGELRFVKEYRGPLAVGVWCGECWPVLLKEKRAEEA